jgi:hypothetical protein
VVIRLLPPYTISEGETERGLKLLDRVLRKGAKVYRESQSGAPAAAGSAA